MRYCKDEAWTIPGKYLKRFSFLFFVFLFGDFVDNRCGRSSTEFEKMIYDNSNLILAYLEGFQLIGKQAFAEIARESLDYVLKTLTAANGQGFFTAEDGDNDGREGVYYVWTKKEIEAVLNPEESEAFCALYGLKETGLSFSFFDGTTTTTITTTTTHRMKQNVHRIWFCRKSFNGKPSTNQ
jgi:uncharacterized protein YyaL (SSP411 family)